MAENAAGPLPGYAVLGAGRWGVMIGGILERMGRRATVIGGLRRNVGESDAAHARRVADMIPDDAGSVWIAVPPGPHSSMLVEVAIGAGRNVLIEKPWPAARPASRALDERARAAGLRVAVHFQYLELSEIVAANRALERGRGLSFAGTFTIGRAARNGIPPLPNLGSHLLALWRWAFPAAMLDGVTVGYECRDRRSVRVGDAEIDFTRNAEPIIQRFVEDFERPAGEADLPSLEFAAEIGELTAALQRDEGARSTGEGETWRLPSPLSRFSADAG
jgi:predicted dehydrogenase